MDIINTILSNSILNIAVLAWFIAQVLKVPTSFIFTKKLRLSRLVGAGGMPSSHSSLVCSTTIALARTQGIASPMFALSFILAGIVMYDAMGVRRAAGEQAKVINKIVFKFRNSDGSFVGVKKQAKTSDNIKKANKKKENIFMDEFPLKELKEFIGHTPLEVLGGAILGILVGVIYPL